MKIYSFRSISAIDQGPMTKHLMLHMKMDGYFNGQKLRYIHCQLVIVLLFCFHLLVSSVSKTVIMNVVPSSNDSCPAKPCLTLNEFSHGANDYRNNYTDITLIFQPGNHSLQSSLIIGHIHTLRLVTSQSDHSPAIICAKESNLDFKSIDTIHIIGIHFSGCGGNNITSVQLLVSHSSFYGTQENSGTALCLTDVIANITRTNFVANNGSICLGPDYVDSSMGGAIFAYHCAFTVSECIFERNNASEGGAISINKFRQYPQSTVIISGSTFNHNSASNGSGGALAIDNTDLLGIVHISESNNVADQEGGALYSYENNVTFDVSTSNFSSNKAYHSYGGAISVRETIINAWSCLFENNSAVSGGAIGGSGNIKLNIVESIFVNNRAKECGGALYAAQSDNRLQKSSLHILGSWFIENEVSSELSVMSARGGAVYSSMTTLTVTNCTFDGNHAISCAALAIGSPYVNITLTFFINNGVTCDTSTCGTLCVSDATSTFKGGDYDFEMSIIENTFINNSIMIASPGLVGSTVDTGSAVVIRSSSPCMGCRVDLRDSKFESNTGAPGLYVSDISPLTVERSNFSLHDYGAIYVGQVSDVVISDFNIILTDNHFVKNTAIIGASVYLERLTTSTVIMTRNLVVNNNASGYGMMYLFYSSVFMKCNTFKNNIGSLYAFNSNLTFMQNTNFEDNISPAGQFQQGGALTTFQSNIIIMGQIHMLNNLANNGGAIHSIESKFQMYESLTIANNIALQTGGGIYLYQSELVCHDQSKLVLSNNHAKNAGGGIHTIGSIISMERNPSSNARVFFLSNTAYYGGGIYLEVNAKIIQLKRQFGDEKCLVFNNNSAHYGGAIFVQDSTYSSTCASKSSISYSAATECFLQTLALFNFDKHSRTSTENIEFTNNNAVVSGLNIYGGLLDRCTISPFTDVYYVQQLRNDHNSAIYVDAVQYIIDVTNIDREDLETIGSCPVRMCFCKGNMLQTDCDYQPKINVKKGEVFSIPASAVDQLNHTIVTAIIHAFLSGNTKGKLGEGQPIQKINAICSNLTYSITSPQKIEQLVLYAEGPCNDAQLSRQTININFTHCTCPIGFQPKPEKIDKMCECGCALSLQQYFNDQQCKPDTKTLTRVGNFWVTYTNASAVHVHNVSGYLTYPNCPLNYCKDPTKNVSINLNEKFGADEQCMKGRGDILCGKCKPGFSLSLNSARCLPCQSNWTKYAVLTVIIICALIAGIALVIFILTLNLTVAVGSLNGLIFYSNVVTIFLPDLKLNFIISWLNLNIGFDTCFFESMDAFWKTLIELLFPLYVLLLVIVVIALGHWSQTFSRLIGRKNPVATLATLILLSYTKFLQIVISSYSYAVLKYPDNSSDVVWYTDATVKYFKGRHMALFTVATLILILGTVYTALLLSWQWIVKWVKSPTLCLFMEQYHAPYTSKYRFLPGLLLLARVVIYIMVSVVNKSNSPQTSLVIIIIVMILVICICGSGSVSRKYPIAVIDTICYINLLLLSVISLYLLAMGTGRDEFLQSAAGYVSISITLALLTGILLYHVYTEVLLKLLKKKDQGQININNDHNENMARPRPRDRNRRNVTHSVVDAPVQRDGVHNNNMDEGRNPQREDGTRDHSSSDSDDSTVPLLEVSNTANNDFLQVIDFRDQ